jgi:hypothetical protein
MNEDQPIPREIVVTMKSEKDAEGKLSTVERWSKVLSIAAIPIVLAVSGGMIQKQIQNQAVSRDYVQIAISILTEPDKSKVSPVLRDWAVDLLNDNSRTKFSPEAAAKLKSGDISLPGGGIAKVDTTIDKSEVSIKASNGEKLRYKLSVTGASPTFKLSCPDRGTLWSETIPPTSETPWVREQADFHSADDDYVFNVASSDVMKYNLVIEHIDASGNVLDVVKDIKGETQSSIDSLNTKLHVRVSR